MDIKQKIISLSQQAGACSIGFADIVEVSQNWREHFDAMINEGRHGSMAFMERNVELRQDPALLLEGAKTLISMAFNYDKGIRHSRIASYALVPDYHYYIRELLKPVTEYLQQELRAECRICVDSAPVAERYWALRTGVGVRGRNQQLMVPGIGARVFLAEIITTAHIEPDPVVTYEGYADVCLGCDRCVRVCPNGALEDPERFDARGCVSYLTIEHRGELPPGVSLAGKIYGCDICLDACPYNHINNPINPSHNTAHINSSGNNTTGTRHIGRLALTSEDTHIQSDCVQIQTDPVQIQSNSVQTDSGEEKSVKDFTVQTHQEHIKDAGSGPCDPIAHAGCTTVEKEPIPPNNGGGDSDVSQTNNFVNIENFYSLQQNAVSPFEIDTDITSLTTQDIENMTSGQYRKLTKKSAMSRCPLSQLRRNL